jgi:cytosine/adenosine deaminase-related metal-dependent hydrolase
VRILSADWVVPIEGPPIRDGAVAIEGGRIAAVGEASELGEGEQHPDAVILPGFVNAHSHLEYAAYAGFGDGLAFPPWLGLHIERKSRLDGDDMLAIARGGAAECLRSGITTVGDCSFSGAAAHACAELGLRATVYLEVFGSDAGLARFHRLRADAASAFSDRVRVGISPHAPYTCTIELYRACAELELPLATHLSESEAELEYLRSTAPPFRHSQEQECSDRTSSPHTACTWPPTRSPCSQSTASASLTARARTRCSAAASLLSGPCARPASPSPSRRTALPRRRPSTCSTSCASR